jgi:hypothetical protein
LQLTVGLIEVRGENLIVHRRETAPFGELGARRPWGGADEDQDEGGSRQSPVTSRQSGAECRPTTAD